MTTNKKYDIAIIGAGIIGSALAYYLSRYKVKILVIEKNPYIADETSHGNGGVIHGGFDASEEEESILNIEGNKLWRSEILKNLKFPHQNTYSLVVAFNEEEMEGVKDLYKRGIKNHLDPKDLKIIDKKELQKLEPHISEKACGALLCTSSVLIDPVAACRAMMSVALKNETKLMKSSEVTHIEKTKEGFEIEINNKFKLETKAVINAAGHYADFISKLAKQKDFNLVARRGEYRLLAKTESFKVKNILYKMPSVYGKGVTVSPLLDGRVLVGPTAEENIKKEDTRLVTREKYELIGQVGHDLIPSLNIERTEKILAGSRPIYKKTNDFLIENSVCPKFINVAGTQSPALSSSPAIALKVINMLKKTDLHLEEKKKFETKFEVVF